MVNVILVSTSILLESVLSVNLLKEATPQHMRDRKVLTFLAVELRNIQFSIRQHILKRAIKPPDEDHTSWKVPNFIDFHSRFKWSWIWDGNVNYVQSQLNQITSILTADIHWICAWFSENPPRTVAPISIQINSCVASAANVSDLSPVIPRSDPFQLPDIQRQRTLNTSTFYITRQSPSLFSYAPSLR